MTAISKTYLTILFFFISLTMISSALASEERGQFSPWQKKSSSNLLETNISVSTYSLNEQSLKALLLTSSKDMVISLPLPNGKLIDYKLTPDKVMSDELAFKYPNIKTFYGVQVNDPSNTGRFDITQHGFHGMFYYQGELVYLEPKTSFISTSVLVDKKIKKNVLARNFSINNPDYQSYFAKRNIVIRRDDFEFHAPKRLFNSFDKSTLARSQTVIKSAKSEAKQSTLITYRLAIATAAEYTQFNGGTVDSAMAELVTLVNRLNEVYQRDLAIKLTLVANNDLLIFTDANTDPFTNTSDDGGINTQVINDLIGQDNYDIGHVVGTAGGGLAALGVVCDGQNKADGVTGTNIPNNDAFYIDYVAHEIGHQFNATHTFNGTEGACDGNRVSNSAYEVGSGSTIMGYAGLCGSQNLQSSSDAFFHGHSIDEITQFSRSGQGRLCGAESSTINNTPVVDAGLDYVIPAQTPFKLSGNASDAEGSNLTYSWQEFDLGTSSNSIAQQVDDGSRPLFRAFSPQSSALRYLPELNTILTGNNVIGEVLPSTNRTLTFRLVVRDGEGGVNSDEKKITVVNTGESFTLDTPIMDDLWASNTQSVQWQVANTDQAPISCTHVDLALSTDGGNQFNTTIASNIINNGLYNVSLDEFCPNDINTDAARLQVACRDNIFFAINSGNFIINKAGSRTDIMITSQQTLSIDQGSSLTLSQNMFTYRCESPTSLSIEAGDNYTVANNVITPNSDFSGTLTVGVVAHKSNFNSATYLATVTVKALANTSTPSSSNSTPSSSNSTPSSSNSTQSQSSGGTIWLMLIMLIVSVTASACSSNTEQVKQEIPLDEINQLSVNAALEQAELEQDFRLLIPATRGVSIPGLLANEYQNAAALCGTKYVKGTGDVLTAELTRDKRNQIIAYMGQYNQTMWQRCQAVKLKNEAQHK